MPPRLDLQRSVGHATRGPLPISTFLVPFLFSKQSRHISILSSISDNPGAYNKRIRRGRGPSSGKGKTSGRGHKGQKQHGKVPAGLTGGQTRLEVVKGIKGSKSPLTEEMSPINVDRIQEWIDQGRLDITKPITVRELQKSRCLHGVKDGVKLLARNANALTTPIHITVSRASDAAIAAIERAGGTVQTRYYTKSSIKRILSGQTHPTQSLLSLPTTTPTPSSASRSTPTTPSSPIPANSTPAEISALDTAALSHTLGYTVPPPQILSALPSPESYAYRLPDPTSRKDLEYYRDPAHRGYLAYQVGVGQGPSLFFRTPVQAKDLEGKERRRREKVKEGAKGLKGEGRLF